MANQQDGIRRGTLAHVNSAQMSHLTINTQLSSTPAHTSVEQKETEAQARLPIQPSIHMRS